MKQNHQEQNPEDCTQQKDQPTEPQQLKAAKTKSRKRKIIIFGTFSGLLFTIAGIAYFVNHALAVLSIVLLMVAVVFAAFAFRLELMNYGSTKRAANSWCATLCFLGVLLCACALFFEVREPSGISPPKLASISPIAKQPYLRLGLVTKPHPHDVLDLERTLLPIESRGFRLSPTGEAVVVTLTEGQLEADLNFEIGNNPKPPVSVENLQFFVAIPADAPSRPDASWQELDSKGIMAEPADLKMVLFVQRLTHTLIPGDAEILPPIFFPRPNPPVTGMIMPVFVNVRAHGITTLHFGFWLVIESVPHGAPNAFPPRFRSLRGIQLGPHEPLVVPNFGEP